MKGRVKNRNKKKSRLIAWLLILSMILPTLPSAGITKAGEGTTVTSDYDTMSIQEILGQDKPLTWLFAGDSITHNAVWSQGMNSYSEWFEQYLYDINRRDDSVILTAWGGADIYDFQTEATQNASASLFSGQGTNADSGMGLENMITKYNPDVVFIKIGMNDRYKTEARYKQYYKQMLNDIYAAGAINDKKPKIVLLTPTPVSSDTVYNTEQTDADSTWRFQKYLTEIATEYNLILCDLITAFTQEALIVGADYSHLFYSDPSDGGIHPNAAGQYLIFKTLSKTLGIYDDSMPIYQMEYLDMNEAALYADDTYIGLTAEYGKAYGLDGATADSTAWYEAVRENNVWVVAGAEQMSGYQGPVVNRSMFRCIDNALRGATCLATEEFNNGTSRDNRLISVAAPGRTVSELNSKYDSLIGRHNHQVFLLLPEVSQVYAEGYVHSSELVAEYKIAVTELLGKENGKTKILWTPLASSDATINTYLSDYATAIREIAASDDTILFYDANKFMNDHMTANISLARNWFENKMYLSPLGALDVAYGFFSYSGLLSADTNGMELKVHNLRLTQDARVFKGKYVRDLISADVTVEGTTVVIDMTPILNLYPEMSNLRIAYLSSADIGNYHKDIMSLDSVTVDGNIYRVEAPCSNPILTIYGDYNGNTYRFKDFSASVTTDSVISQEIPAPTEACLESLTVVGAPSIGFAKDTTNYDVELYQYQRNVQIVAEAQHGLTITVNGTEVQSGVNSGLISVESTTTVTVKVSGIVSGTQEEKTYTLNLSRVENPDIIITEVMIEGYYQYEDIYTDDTETKKFGADNYELIEIYNASGRDLNLLDYSIGYKNDHTYVDQISSKGAWAYYFTGNDQAFASQHTAGKTATYTGINEITKYSSYWSDGSYTEPEEVLFKADSTMVIWVKSSPNGKSDKAKEYGAALTYETLQAALEKHKGTHTLTVDLDGVETAVVPKLEQLVVAEVPMGIGGISQSRRSNVTPEKAFKNFLLQNIDAHAVGTVDSATRKVVGARSWLFVLKDTATQAQNGAITEAGDDIISAARLIRPGKAEKGTDGTYIATGDTDKLSSVLSYDSDRGMSLVKNQAYWDAETISQGHTSEQQGYSNLTSFGAIEYWQKPQDVDDNTAPIVKLGTRKDDNNRCIDFNFDITDDADIRYIELNITELQSQETTTIKRDLVLENCVKNGGVATDITAWQGQISYNVPEQVPSISYTGYVLDGNGNKTTFEGKEKLSLKEVVVRYDNIAEYRGVDGYTAPILEGYVFAGWFSSKTCKTPIADYRKSGTAYAKFVPEDILSVKAQITANLVDDNNENDDTAAIRFITSVDTLQYKEVGFTFEITDVEGVLTKASDIVYDKLYAINPETGAVEQEEHLLTYTPQTTFHRLSAYFKTFTFYQLQKTADYAKEFKVTPFWITLDGTTVYGTSAVKSVQQGIEAGSDEF